MNPHLQRLQPYPFQRLHALIADVQPPAGVTPIALSIGEPRHAPPAKVLAVLQDPALLAASLSRYPPTAGTDELRRAARDWLQQRFALGDDALDLDQILPVTGTREALFALAQTLVDTSTGKPRVLMPNPFYQIYEGAALLAGAEPVYVPCPARTGYLADIDAIAEQDWAECQLYYVCSPGNPCGAAMTTRDWARILELADAHDFVIAADECYSEIYLDETAPPTGLLQACTELGRTDFARCIVFHSLSKRSNLPGLRSGFVAGDAKLINRFLAYRTYHGCGMPLHVQHASALAWTDEDHVQENRNRYRAKFDAVLPILAPVLDVARPDAGFFLWPAVPGKAGDGHLDGHSAGKVNDEAFVRKLYADTGVLALPGRYLSRPTAVGDPGAGRIRLALVAPLQDCIDAAGRIADQGMRNQ